jgi:hypothetical protein
VIAFALVALMIARSLVPVAGVLFFGWSPDRVLLLCFADTMLTIGAMITALVLTQARTEAAAGPVARSKAFLGGFVGGAFFTGLLAIPLGLPLFFMLGDTKYFLWLTLTDPSFRLPLALQTLAACWWGAVVIRQLRTQTPEQTGVKPLFTLTLLRWIVLVGVAYTGIPMMLGRAGPYFLVAVYSATMIASELNPRRFLRIMPSRGR